MILNSFFCSVKGAQKGLRWPPVKPFKCNSCGVEAVTSATLLGTSAALLVTSDLQDQLSILQASADQDAAQATFRVRTSLLGAI